MAVLGLFSDLPFNRLNAVKQLLSFVVNACAATFLVFSGKIEWTLVAVMAPAAMIGGRLGGRFAGSVSPQKLRVGVIIFAFVVAIVYLVRLPDRRRTTLSCAVAAPAISLSNTDGDDLRAADERTATLRERPHWHAIRPFIVL